MRGLARVLLLGVIVGAGTATAADHCGDILATGIVDGVMFRKQERVREAVLRWACNHESASKKTAQDVGIGSGLPGEVPIPVNGDFRSDEWRAWEHDNCRKFMDNRDHSNDVPLEVRRVDARAVQAWEACANIRSARPRFGLDCHLDERGGRVFLTIGYRPAGRVANSDAAVTDFSITGVRLTSNSLEPTRPWQRWLPFLRDKVPVSVGTDPDRTYVYEREQAGNCARQVSVSLRTDKGECPSDPQDREQLLTLTARHTVQATGSDGREKTAGKDEIFETDNHGEWTASCPEGRVIAWRKTPYGMNTIGCGCKGAQGGAKPATSNNPDDWSCELQCNSDHNRSRCEYGTRTCTWTFNDSECGVTFPKWVVCASQHHKHGLLRIGCVFNCSGLCRSKGEFCVGPQCGYFAYGGQAINCECYGPQACNG